MTHRRHRALRVAVPALAALFAVLALAAPARARMMRHLDLASLALVSDAVVFAERGATRTLAPYVTATSYRVTRVFAGPLRVGDVVEVGDQGYSLRPMVGAAPAGALEPQVALFLARNTNGAAAGPAPAWWLAPSGLRVAFSGRVYRFVQEMNPGPYEPVPQGDDPADVRGEAPAGSAAVGPVSWAAFESMLARALVRAADVRAALALPAGAPRTARLLALLPPAPPPDAVPGAAPDTGFYADLVGERVAADLAARGELGAALEARARTPGMRPARLEGTTAAALFAYAADASHPLLARVAALETAWDAEPPTAADVTRAAALLGDAQPEVRGAAARAVGRARRYTFGEPGGAARAAAIERVAAAALGAAWAREAHDAVRFAIVQAAGSASGRPLPLPTTAARPGWVLLTRVAGDVLEVAVGALAGRTAQVRDARVEARPAGGGGAAAACRGVARRSWMTSGATGAASYAFDCRADVAHGAYALRATVTVDPGDGRTVTRVVELGTRVY